MPVVAERRGRHSKHQHSIETAVAVMGPGQQRGGPLAAWTESAHQMKLTMYQVPDEFHMILESIILELAQLELMTLHQAICDPNSGPALCLLIQVRPMRNTRSGLSYTWYRLLALQTRESSPAMTMS